MEEAVYYIGRIDEILNGFSREMPSASTENWPFGHSKNWGSRQGRSSYRSEFFSGAPETMSPQGGYGFPGVPGCKEASMNADTAVVNGRIVDGQHIYPGVVTIRHGEIMGITQSLEDRPGEVIDARGLYVLPGAIDGHVHMMDPGYTEREDFTTGTKAAARAG